MNSTADNPTEAARRLENALERIALAMANSMVSQVAADQASPEPDTASAARAAEVKARLDVLISKLRAGLADSPR